jgi:hypothetical protein
VPTGSLSRVRRKEDACRDGTKTSNHWPVSLMAVAASQADPFSSSTEQVNLAFLRSGGWWAVCLAQRSSGGGLAEPMR